MAEIHARMSPAEQKQRRPWFSVLTASEMLLPDHDSNSSPYRVSDSSFLSSDTDPPSPSSIGVSSPPSNDSIEFGNPAAFLIPIRAKPAPPLSNPRLYPSYEHGSPLSDIGEEDTPRTKRARSKTPSPIASSPTIAPQSASHSPPRRIQRPEKRLSEMSSSSTLSTGSDQRWESFDGMTYMSDRLRADLAAMGDDNLDLDGPGGQRSSTITMGDEDHMSQALSSRAEQILANAKKRLTHMEGNLSRARGSLLIAPKQSPNLGEQKEVGGLYTSISQGADRRLLQGSTPRKPRPFRSLTKGLNATHTKNLSETSVPSHSPRYGKPVEIRSASAMEYGPGGTSIDAMLHDRSSNTFTNGAPRPLRRSQTSPFPDPREVESSSSTDVKSVDAVGSPHLGRRDDKAHSRIRSHDSAFGLTRSQSQTTSRELRDHTNDLKDIQNQRKSRQGEPARRNSFQNLRTESSFADAKKWYAGAAEYNGGESPLSTNAGMGWKRHEDQREQSTYDPSPISPNAPELLPLPKSPSSPRSPRSPRSSQSPLLAPESPIEHQTSYFGRKLQSRRGSVSPPSFLRSIDGDRDDQSSYIQESHYEDAFEGRLDGADETIAASEEEQIFLNEVLEESLQDAEPQVPPITEDILQSTGEPERHEDRADAFDYENFFLHSALGNYSQQAFHRRDISEATAGSRLSYGSSASMETTRAPQPEEENDGVDDGGQDMDDVDERGGQQRDQGSFLDDELPTPTGPRPPFVPHFRSSSADSSSSAATFATATEGGGGGSGNDMLAENETVPDEILNWGEPSIAGGWPSPPVHLSRAGGTPKMINGHGSPLRSERGASTQSYFPSTEMFSPPPRTRTANPESPSPSPPTQPPEQAVSSHPTNHNHNHNDYGDDSSDADSSDHRPLKDPNTEILISALIALANPDFQSSSAPFTEPDQDLVINLLRSVGAVCEGINDVTNQYKAGGPSGGGRREEAEEQGWLLRRRLEVARRVLEGDEEADGFIDEADL